MTLVLMFPGQSSRGPGMIERVVDASPGAAARLQHASSVLGRDLRATYAAPDGGFTTNRDVQVGVFLTNHLWAEALRDEGLEATFSLGLSLGEYNHLVDIGALAFDDALRLVDVRGRLYDEGPRGMMAAVAPMPVDELRQIVDAHGGRVDIGNINSPTQCVLSGERADVEAVLAVLADEHFIEGVVIEPHIPMHSRVFEPVAGRFAPHLAAAPWRTPHKPYVSNVAGGFVDAPTADRVAALLTRHVSSPVLWRECVEAVAARDEGAVFVEAGPRTVLCNLLGRRWLPHARIALDGTAEEFAATVARLRAPA